MSEANKSDTNDPISNDEWFDSHILKKLDKLEFDPSGHYFVNVGLCWNRHRYTDDHDGRVTFSVFPAYVFHPQDWTQHWSHAVRFLTALHNKLKSFDQEFARVDLRVFLSGASGCRDALKDAFHDNVKRKGFPYFRTPFTWKYIPMHFHLASKKYEGKPDIYSHDME